MDITIYTRLNCKKCLQFIEERLDARFAYTEKIVNTNLADKMEFVKHGFIYVPAIVIKEDGEIIFKKDNMTLEEFDNIVEDLKDGNKGKIIT